MTKDEILKELNEKAVCTIGDYRAIADKNPQMIGAYKVEGLENGVWKILDSALPREDAAGILHRVSAGKSQPLHQRRKEKAG